MASSQENHREKYLRCSVCERKDPTHLPLTVMCAVSMCDKAEGGSNLNLTKIKVHDLFS